MALPNRAAKPTYPIFLCLALLFAVGVGLWGAVYHMTDGGQNGPSLLIDVGTAGLGIAFAAVLGGLVSMLFDEWAARRQAIAGQNAYYAQLLEDFKTVYNTVERARFLITAHKSAKTYGERMRMLPDAVILLHNVKRSTQQGFPDLYEDLEGPIFFCMQFLKGLIEEYRDEYLAISRQQAQDEADNKTTRELIATQEFAGKREISNTAWTMLMELPHLRL